MRVPRPDCTSRYFHYINFMLLTLSNLAIILPQKNRHQHLYPIYSNICPRIYFFSFHLLYRTLGRSIGSKKAQLEKLGCFSLSMQRGIVLLLPEGQEKNENLTLQNPATTTTSHKNDLSYLARFLSGFRGV